LINVENEIVRKDIANCIGTVTATMEKIELDSPEKVTNKSLFNFHSRIRIEDGRYSTRWTVSFKHRVFGHGDSNSVVFISVQFSVKIINFGLLLAEVRP